MDLGEAPVKTVPAPVEPEVASVHIAYIVQLIARSTKLSCMIPSNILLNCINRVWDPEAYLQLNSIDTER